MRHQVAVLVVCLGSAPSLQAQSLGDLARQEAERRQTTGAAKKVYTDKDAKRLEREAPVVAGATAPGSAPTVAPSDATPVRPGDMEAMRVKAEALLGGRLDRLNTEGKQKNEQYRMLVAQASGACSGSTKAKSASVSSTFLGYNPLILVNPDGSTRIEPNPIFATTTTVGVTAIDNSTTPACRGLTAKVRVLGSWAKQAQRELDAMEIAAKREGIYPGVVRSLIASRLTSW